MYTIEKIDLLKSDIRTAIQTWGENKIDQLCSAHPRLSTASIYTLIPQHYYKIFFLST